MGEIDVGEFLCATQGLAANPLRPAAPGKRYFLE